MKVKVTYLDADNKKATEEKAEWKIIAEYDKEGNLQKEAWINLKKKKKKKIIKKKEHKLSKKEELEIKLLEEKLSLIKKKSKVCDKLLEENKDEDV